MTKKIYVIITLLFFGATPFTIAQEYKGKPKWVKWMRTDQHYFKTCERFAEYWEHHYKPLEQEESEEQQTEDPRRWIVKLFQSQEKAKQQSNDLLMDYKYFKKWRFQMEPYVRSDGSIMTKEERLKAWEDAQTLK